MDNLDKILEGLLFLAGDGLDRGVIMEKLQVTPKELNKAIETLKQRYNEDCGINMITYKDKLQLCASPKFADDVSLVLNPIRERQLTKATLEVMAIIAYKQPVTRLDVQEIRGINSDYAIQTLLNYKLIEVVGRKDAVGKPLLFGTTDEFLRHFGIESLEDLPDYSELLKDIEKIQLENSHLYHEFDIADEEKTDAENTEENTVENPGLNIENFEQEQDEKVEPEALENLDEQQIENITKQNQEIENAELDNFDEKQLEDIIQKDVEKNQSAEDDLFGIDWSVLEDNPDIEIE